MMRLSSSPIAPCSPACGLSPATARRGCSMPNSDFSPAAAMRPTRTMPSGCRARATAWASDRWMVTGTTRSSGQASIMATSAPPASSARNSVWPGCLKPASCSVFFWMGLVTMPAISPAWASRGALDRLDRRRRRWPDRAGPALAGAGASRAAPAAPSRRRRRLRPACAILRTGTSRPSLPASAARRAGSSSAKNGRALSPRASHALRLSSPPTPAGSPIVTASGSGEVMA